jgi:predicted metal-dependent hydrolase
MTLDWTQGSLAEGLRLYEAGEFFAAHEAWEGRWVESQEPEKTFLQGLIQVTAAFHHLQRKNPLGTMRLLQFSQGRACLGASPEQSLGTAST